MIDFGNGQAADNFQLSISLGDSCKPFFNTHVGSSYMAGVTSSEALSLRKWTHIAATQAGSLGTMYINGVLVASSEQPPLAKVVRTKNYLGYTNWRNTSGGGGGDAPSDAEFDEIKIFDRCLSASEILGDFKMTASYVTSL